MPKSKSKSKGQKKQKDEDVEQVSAATVEKPTPPPVEEKKEEMPEERTVVLKPVNETPQAGQGGAAPASADPNGNPEDWMIVVSMKNRQNSILHVAGLMNLIVSLELIGKSATNDPDVKKNPVIGDIYFHNVNEAQTLAMIHITQLVVQHGIKWEEVLESMVADYMQNMPPADRTKEKETDVRAQAYSVISTGYDIINRCRNTAMGKVGGAGAVDSKPA